MSEPNANAESEDSNRNAVGNKQAEAPPEEAQPPHRDALSNAGAGSEDESTSTKQRPGRVPLLEAAKLTYTGSYDVELDDDGRVYKRSRRLEAFVTSLAQAPEKLGKGVEWYDLQDGLDSDSEDKKGLVTRKDSRGIVDAVLKHAHAGKYSRTMSFIIGSHGIGKTRTLTYLLRQVLQQENVNVQYFDQKETQASLFLRRNGMTYAYVSALIIPAPAQGSLFTRHLETNDLRTYILLDPSENGAAYSHPSRAHLVVACSANVQHFHNIQKEAAAELFYLGLPSTEETEIMAKKLAPGLGEKVLLSRMNDVGPVPRYLFREDKEFRNRKADIIEKAKLLEDTDEDLVVQALTKGSTITNNPTLCGALFAHVNVYEDNVTDYRQQRISVQSQFAAWMLYQRFRNALVRATIAGEECDTRAVFEKLCAFDLIVGGYFKYVNMATKSEAQGLMELKPTSSVIRVLPSRPNPETRALFVKPALMGQSSFVTDYKAIESPEPPTKKPKISGPPFIVLSDGFPAIDFLNTARQVFQATVSDDHDMNGWVDLLIDAEILSLDNKGKVKINPKAKPLEFYWVVPKHRVNWAKKKPKMPTNADFTDKYRRDKDVIDKAITKHVRQYVIFIGDAQPRQLEIWSSLIPLQGIGERCLLM